MLSKPAMLLLGMIWEGKKGAYEITKKIELMNMRWWLPIADSTVYATTRTLESKGYIIGETERYGKMPERTVYTITDAGLKELKDSVAKSVVKVDFDTTVYSIASSYLRLFEKEQILDLLNKRLDQLKEYENGIEENVQKLIQYHVEQIYIDNIERSKEIMKAEVISVKRLMKTVGEGNCS